MNHEKKPATSRQPNILIFLTDQLRWDCLGFAGNRDIKTPNLDRVASGGTVYPDAFCTAPLCTPSRASLLTGLHVNQHLSVENRSTLPTGIPTFPQLLRGAGYRTSAVGKMHLTPTYQDVGFEYMSLAEQDGDGRFRDDYHSCLVEEGLIDINDLVDQRPEFRSEASPEYWANFGAERSNLPPDWYSSTWIADRAIDEIDGWSSDRNLLLVSFIKPHHPFDPPAPWDEAYSPEDLEVLPGWTDRIPPQDIHTKGYFPNGSLDEPALRRVMAHYYGSIAHMDQQVGRILSKLHERDLYRDTLIIFTTDHGEYLGFHHLLLKHGHMYDPLMRIPLVIKTPGQRQGRVDDRLVSAVDIPVTLLGCAGINPHHLGDGRDLASPDWSRDYVFAQTGLGHYMVRSRSHKLLYEKDHRRRLFFDLTMDPLELNDRYQTFESRQLVEDYKAALTDWLAFEVLPPNHVQMNAPEIDPIRGDGSRDPVAMYRETDRLFRGLHEVSEPGEPDGGPSEGM